MLYFVDLIILIVTKNPPIYILQSYLQPDYLKLTVLLLLFKHEALPIVLLLLSKIKQ